MQTAGKGIAKRVMLARLLVALSLLIALASLFLLAYSLLPVRLAEHTQSVTDGQRSVQSESDNMAIRATAQEFMHSLISGNYHSMWQRLHPHTRALWPSERAFTTYWQARFRDYTVQGFTLDQVTSRATWVNPQTMERYSAVAVVPVSLQLTSGPAIAQDPHAPPEDVHPSQLFRNLPLVVQRAATTGDQANKWLVLAGGPADLEAPILPPLQPAAKAVQAPILMYHHISDTPAQNALDRSLTVSTQRFKQQLDYLKAQGYKTITFNQLFDALYYGGPLPPRPIILTFDDGYDDAYKFAYPILQAHSYSGMFYIITGKVGWPGQMTWPQIRDMLAHGMQMGSHTIHHVDMGQVYLNSQLQAQQEVQVSQITLQQQLGIPIQQFCYPSGEPFRHGSLTLQQQVTDLLAANGYVGATTDPGQTGVIQTSQSPLALLRVRVDGRESLATFEGSIP